MLLLLLTACSSNSLEGIYTEFDWHSELLGSWEDLVGGSVTFVNSEWACTTLSNGERITCWSIDSREVFTIEVPAKGIVEEDGIFCAYSDREIFCIESVDLVSGPQEEPYYWPYTIYSQEEIGDFLRPTPNGVFLSTEFGTFAVPYGETASPEYRESNAAGSIAWSPLLRTLWIGGPSGVLEIPYPDYGSETSVISGEGPWKVSEFNGRTLFSGEEFSVLNGIQIPETGDVDSIYLHSVIGNSIYYQESFALALPNTMEGCGFRNSLAEDLYGRIYVLQDCRVEGVSIGIELWRVWKT